MGDYKFVLGKSKFKSTCPVGRVLQKVLVSFTAEYYRLPLCCNVKKYDLFIEATHKSFECNRPTEKETKYFYKTWYTVLHQQGGIYVNYQIPNTTFHLMRSPALTQTPCHLDILQSEVLQGHTPRWKKPTTITRDRGFWAQRRHGISFVKPQPCALINTYTVCAVCDFSTSPMPIVRNN